MFNRQLLVKLHLIMAGLTLAIAVMFFITGALYTWNYKPSSYSTEYRIQVEKPLHRDYKLLKSVTRVELAKLGINEPLGKAKLKSDRKRNSYKFTWSGKNHRATLRPSSKGGLHAVLTVKTPSWYNRFMRLHKGKGGDIFDIFAISASIVFLFILISGVIIGLQVPIFRKLTLYSLGGGCLLFAGLVIYAQFF
ncbi:MAG: hypothetical protein Q9M28_03960 [Mariprofundaceae bacterium]|nr:hypothetical protein [Mariprofundaceae bacterium]